MQAGSKPEVAELRRDKTYFLWQRRHLSCLKCIGKLPFHKRQIGDVRHWGRYSFGRRLEHYSRKYIQRRRMPSPLDVCEDLVRIMYTASGVVGAKIGRTEPSYFHTGKVQSGSCFRLLLIDSWNGSSSPLKNALTPSNGISGSAPRNSVCLLVVRRLNTPKAFLWMA